MSCDREYSDCANVTTVYDDTRKRENDDANHKQSIREIALVMSVMDSILHKGTRADNACVCIDVKNIGEVRKIGEILDLL